MKYLLDTNALSEIWRGQERVVTWMQSVDPADVCFSVITLGEVMRGVALKQRRDPLAAARFLASLTNLRRDFAERILPVTEQVALEWGRIAALRTRGSGDGLIAATAIVHGMIVVTRNVADFHDTGAAYLNPWDP